MASSGAEPPSWGDPKAFKGEGGEETDNEEPTVEQVLMVLAERIRENNVLISEYGGRLKNLEERSAKMNDTISKILETVNKGITLKDVVRRTAPVDSRGKVDLVKKALVAEFGEDCLKSTEFRQVGDVVYMRLTEQISTDGFRRLCEFTRTLDGEYERDKNLFVFK